LFITGGYHRYFAHRSYRLGRFAQFVMALGGCTAMQKGPLWWASHHRVHHKYSDTERDTHSPKKGVWWSHLGWILCYKYEAPLYDKIKDFVQYPELRFLDKFHLLPPMILAITIWYFFGISGLIVGFCVSTVLLYHGTFAINSLAHIFGSRRYATSDTSRNSMILALITCGEGWHNNHHHFQASVRQGFRWWEIDLTYYVLRFLSWLKIAKELRLPKAKTLKHRLIADGCFDIGMFNAYYEKALRSINCVKNDAITIYEKKQAALAQFMDQTKDLANELANSAMEHEANNL
ncbi:MAG TPA: acyl-CoA desaturase, partial [Myxococcota bacterium]|nr:acyl-CoA desaturase [Myxococcota bacterium]